MHYDENYKAYYWYNCETEESEWKVEPPEVNRESTEIELHEEGLEISTAMNTQERCDIISFRISVLVHAALIEGPLGLIEALVRCVVCAIVWLLLNSFPRDWHSIRNEPFPFLQESLKSLACALTLMLPFAACTVYMQLFKCDCQSSELETEWGQHPLPTVLGWCDARRFFIFYAGGTSYATVDASERTSVIFRDSWRGEAVIAPRNIMKLIRDIWR